MSSIVFYINKGDRTSQWVGHSKLKELDINDFLERKHMIDDMEAELTEAPKTNSNNDNLEVAEEENVDEAITTESKSIKDVGIDPKEERNTQVYKEAMKIDIENNNTFETRNKVYTTQWRKIYEVIEPEFLRKSDTYPDGFFLNVSIMQMNLLIYQLR